MSPGQMLPGQKSQWQLESVVDVPRALCLKFDQNQVIDSWDNVVVVFVVVAVIFVVDDDVVDHKNFALNGVLIVTKVWSVFYLIPA